MNIRQYAMRVASWIRTTQWMSQVLEKVALRRADLTAIARNNGFNQHFLCIRSDIELQLMFSELHYPPTLGVLSLGRIPETRRAEKWACTYHSTRVAPIGDELSTPLPANARQNELTRYRQPVRSVSDGVRRTASTPRNCAALTIARDVSALATRDISRRLNAMLAAVFGHHVKTKNGNLWCVAAERRLERDKEAPGVELLQNVSVGKSRKRLSPGPL